MPEASNVYRNHTINEIFDPGGVAHFRNHDIFYKHANPPGLETN